MRVSGEVAGVLGSGVLQNMVRGWWGFMEGCGSRPEVPWRGGEKRGRESMSEKKRRFRTWVPHEVRVAKKSWIAGGRKRSVPSDADRTAARPEVASARSSDGNKAFSFV